MFCSDERPGVPGSTHPPLSVPVLGHKSALAFGFLRGKVDAGAAGDSNLVPVVAMLGRVSCPRSASSIHVLIRGPPPHFYAPLLTVPSVRGTLDGVRCFPDPCNAPLGCEQDHQCVSWFPKCGGLS